MQAATPGQEHVPPVLILVCDNTDIAEVFYRKISGETEVATVTEADVAEVLGEENEEAAKGNGNSAPNTKSGKRKTTTVYGKGAIFPELFSNTPDVNRTIRIDTKLLAEAESDDPKKKRQDAAEELRQVTGDRRVAQRRVDALRPATVRTDDGAGTGVAEGADGRERLDEAHIVHDAAVLDLHVVVHAQQDALASDIDIADGLLLHG